MGNLSMKKIVNWAETGLLWASIFLLSWQLRYTILFAEIGGGYFEYGSWQIYATDLVMMALLVVGGWRFGRQVFKPLPLMIGLPLMAVMFWMMASITVSANWQLTLVTTLHWWLAALWCGYLINRVKRVEEILWPLVIGLSVQGGGDCSVFIKSFVGTELVRRIGVEPIATGSVGNRSKWVPSFAGVWLDAASKYFWRDDGLGDGGVIGTDQLFENY